MKTTTRRERGTLDEVWAQEGYGVVVTGSGERLEFDHHDVLDRDFDRMRPGAVVEFERQAAGNALRAVSVRLVG